MACAKVRIRFRKAGDLRLVSHHDLMRCFERMLRRADLPYHSTEGFHPKPRLVFALSLGLGIVGSDEVVEIELDRELSALEIHDRLARQAPPGLEVLSIRAILPRSTAQVRRVTYRVALPPDCPRGPFLTQGAILKITANGTTTTKGETGITVMPQSPGRNGSRKTSPHLGTMESLPLLRAAPEAISGRAP
jgi:radical SAM-linked protein